MNNEPAFPCGTDVTQGMFAPSSGMTLRDYFAAKAMQGELAAMSSGDGVCGLSMQVTDKQLSELATLWFRVADAMMKARGES